MVPSMGSWNLKAHPQWHTSPNKAMPANPSHTFLLTGDQAFKHMSLWWPFPLKPPHWNSKSAPPDPDKNYFLLKWTFSNFDLWFLSLFRECRSRLKESHQMHVLTNRRGLCEGAYCIIHLTFVDCDLILLFKIYLHVCVCLCTPITPTGGV